MALHRTPPHTQHFIGAKA